MTDVVAASGAPAGFGDRYANAQNRFSVRNSDAPSAMPKLVKNLRKSFDAEKTLSKAWRLKQLAQFKKMMVEGQAEIEQALMLDLNKNKTDAFLTEIGPVLGEIDLVMKSLNSWMKPEKTKVPLALWPAKSYTVCEPLGVALILGAWNYPIHLSLVPMVGAIAAGNCVILKPGSYAHATSNVMKKLITKYMDQTCIRAVEGDRDLSTALLKERFDMIFYTGSTYVGRIVARAAAEYLTPCVLELGGKSPCIIDKDANIKLAAKRVLFGAYNNSGQLCVRTDHLLVHKKVEKKFIKEFTAQLKEQLGSDIRNSEYYGRLVNHGAFKRLAELLDENKDKLVFGGETDESDRFISPALFNFGSDYDAFMASTLMQDELFGPLVPMCTFDDEEKVVKHCKNLPTGKPLALYLFTSNSSFIAKIRKRTFSGSFIVNEACAQLLSHHLPFGGVGNSGMGSYHGRTSFKVFSHEKSFLQRNAFVDQLAVNRPFQDARFPQYTSFKKKVLKVLM